MEFEENSIDIEELYGGDENDDNYEEDEEVNLESYDEEMDWQPVFNLNDDEY